MYRPSLLLIKLCKLTLVNIVGLTQRRSALFLNAITLSKWHSNGSLHDIFCSIMNFATETFVTPSISIILLPPPKSEWESESFMDFCFVSFDIQLAQGNSIRESAQSATSLTVQRMGMWRSLIPVKPS
jgi:hypothetical protein